MYIVLVLTDYLFDKEIGIVSGYVIWISIYPFLMSCHVVFREGRGGGRTRNEHARSGGRRSSSSSHLGIAERKDSEKEALCACLPCGCTGNIMLDDSFVGFF